MTRSTGLAGSEAPSAASAIDWIQWSSSAGGNDHFYAVQFVPEGITWAEANVAANTIGADSHLATITSVEENDFVSILANSDPDFHVFGIHGPWLGGFQELGAAEPDQGWRWVTDEPFDFTNWDGGEPNNTFLGPVPGFGGEEIPIGSAENHLHYKGSVWNDLPGESQLSAYVIEAVTLPSAHMISQSVSFDGEQAGRGRFDTTQGYRDSLAVGDGHRAGLVFEDVALPEGAEIESATLTLTAARSRGASAAIKVKLYDDPDGIAESGRGVLTDPGFDTFDFVRFPSQGRWEDGETIVSPDLAELVQQLIDCGPGGDGNFDLAFSLSARKGLHKLQPEEFGDDVAAVLDITYTLPEIA